MRRRLIRTVLPILFCLVPPLAALLIGAALPVAARSFYFAHFTHLDMLIVVLGLVLFATADAVELASACAGSAAASTNAWTAG